MVKKIRFCLTKLSFGLSFLFFAIATQFLIEKNKFKIFNVNFYANFAQNFYEIACGKRKCCIIAFYGWDNQYVGRSGNRSIASD